MKTELLTRSKGRIVAGTSCNWLLKFELKEEHKVILEDLQQIYLYN